MATASDLIKDSLLLLTAKEAGESLTADEETDGLRALNRMLGSWSNQGLIQYGRTQISHTLTSGDGTYTIGASGDITTTVPVTIESAFIRDANNNDLEIDLISDAQYASIQLKTTTASYPSWMNYNREFPDGTLSLYPIPNANYTLFLNVIPQMATYSLGSDTVSLPQGYEEAIVYNLAVRLAPQFKLPQAYSEIKAQAVDSLKWIKTVNGTNTPILNSPVAAIANNNRFNIYSGYWA